MRCNSRSLAAAVVICVGASLAAAACGSPPSSSSATPDGPGKTATAAFDAVNRKLVAGGGPTLAPGTDPHHPYRDSAITPFPTRTPGPSPTPLAPTCGSTIAGWDEILAKYGGFYKGNGCGVYDGQLVIATEGIDGGPGAIATYQCQPTDAGCLRGMAPDAPGAAWSLYPAPYRGGVGIVLVGDTSPYILILLGGRCFNLSTHAYDLNPGCH